MIQVDTHLLASREGYTTFAKSSAVQPAEQRELEELVYGQPDDAAIYASMATEAVAMLRRLRSTRRFALSRILAGGTDSAGRETIAVCTMLMGATEYQALARSDLWRLLHSTQLWSVDLFRKGQQLTLPDSPANPHTISATDVSFFDAWIAAKGRPNSVAVTGASAANHRAIVALTQVLDSSDLLDFTWGCRLLSIPSGVGIASVAQRGIEQNSRRAVLAPTATPTTPAGKRALAIVGSANALPSTTAQPVAPHRLTAQNTHCLSIEDDLLAPGGSTRSGSGRRAGGGHRASPKADFDDALAQFTPKRMARYGVAAVLLIIAVVAAILFANRSNAADECRRFIEIARQKAEGAAAQAATAKDNQTATGLDKATAAAESAKTLANEAKDAAAKANEHARLSGWPFKGRAESDAKAADDHATGAQKSAGEAEVSKLAAKTSVDSTKASETASADPPPPNPSAGSTSFLEDARAALKEVRAAPKANEAKVYLDKFVVFIKSTHKSFLTAKKAWESAKSTPAEAGAKATLDAAEKAKKETVAMQAAASIACEKLVASEALSEAKLALKHAREFFDESALVNSHVETVSKNADFARTAAARAAANVEKTVGFACSDDALQDNDATQKAAAKAKTMEIAANIAFQKSVAMEKCKLAEKTRKEMKGAAADALPPLAKNVEALAAEVAAAADAATAEAEKLEVSDASDVATEARSDEKSARGESVKANALAAEAKRSANVQGRSEDGVGTDEQPAVDNFDPTLLTAQIVDLSNKLFSADTSGAGVQGVSDFADRITKQDEQTILNYVYVPKSNNSQLKEYGALLFNVRWAVEVLKKMKSEKACSALAKAFDKLAGIGKGYGNHIKQQDLDRFFKQFQDGRPPIEDAWLSKNKNEPPGVDLNFSLVSLGGGSFGGSVQFDLHSKNLESKFQSKFPGVSIYSIVYLSERAIADWIEARINLVNPLITQVQNANRRMPSPLPRSPVTPFDDLLKGLSTSPIAQLQKLSESVAELEKVWRTFQNLHEKAIKDAKP